MLRRLVRLGTSSFTDPPARCRPSWQRDAAGNVPTSCHLDLDEQESVRIQYLVRLACYDLLKAMQEDEDY
jgi:hypothetical protein